MMDSLIIHDVPEAKLPTMLVAFAGWPDAAGAATGAVRYLLEKLPAKKFAEIDPEEFYDFSVVRPEVYLDEEGERAIRWPSNEMYYYAPEDESGGFVLYVGTEPNLRWRTLSNIVAGVAEERGVKFVVSLGSLLDAVPHTREPLVTGRASPSELAQKIEWLGIRSSNYQGPVGIHTAFMETCIQRGMAYASLWGHSPHYLTMSPNSKVSYALLTKLKGLVELDVDLDEMSVAGEAFDAEVTQAIARQADVSGYVRRLERRYDADYISTTDFPSSEAMVEELEEFLKSQRPPSDGQGDS